MTKTKRIVSFILCIALSISCLTVIAFACTLYKSNVTKTNVETAYYDKAGRYQYSTFSWGGTNHHPSFLHTEYYRGVIHGGTLNKNGYINGGTTTKSTSGGYAQIINWIGYYSGNITGGNHPG